MLNPRTSGICPKHPSKRLAVGVCSIPLRHGWSITATVIASAAWHPAEGRLDLNPWTAVEAGVQAGANTSCG